MNNELIFILNQVYLLNNASKFKTCNRINNLTNGNCAKGYNDYKRCPLVVHYKNPFLKWLLDTYEILCVSKGVT